MNPGNPAIEELPKITKCLAIRKIGKGIPELISGSELPNLSVHDSDNNLYLSLNSQGQKTILYRYNDDYLVVNSSPDKAIDSGGIHCKTWLHQLKSFQSDNKDIFSASLILENSQSSSKPYSLWSDNFAIGINISQENFSCGANRPDAYSGCYDKIDIGVAPYGLTQHAYMIKNELSYLVMVPPEEFKLSKKEFEEFTTPLFEPENGMVKLTHNHAMEEYLIDTIFFNSLEKMIESGSTGEILINNLHKNKEPLMVIFPPKYRYEDDHHSHDPNIVKTALALQDFVKRFNGSEVSFAMFDENDRPVIINLEKSFGIVQQHPKEDKEASSRNPNHASEEFSTSRSPSPPKEISIKSSDELFSPSPTSR